MESLGLGYKILPDTPRFSGGAGYLGHGGMVGVMCFAIFRVFVLDVCFGLLRHKELWSSGFPGRCRLELGGVLVFGGCGR